MPSHLFRLTKHLGVPGSVKPIQEHFQMKSNVVKVKQQLNVGLGHYIYFRRNLYTYLIIYLVQSWLEDKVL